MVQNRFSKARGMAFVYRREMKPLPGQNILVGEVSPYGRTSLRPTPSTGAPPP
jgi:hypothetical protein